LPKGFVGEADWQLCAQSGGEGGSEPVRYIPWDFKHYAKLRGGEVLPDLAPVIAACLDATGLYLCAPTPPSQEARRTNDSAWVRATAPV
jgi:hypothetical protein